MSDIEKMSSKYAIKSRLEGGCTFGSLILDALVGGEIPRGVLIDLAGKEGSGKSTALLHTIKSNAALGRKCAYIDLEGGVNASQLEGIGVAEFMRRDTLSRYGANPDLSNGSNLVDFFFAQTFEDCEEILDLLMKEGYEIVVIDSIQAIKPKKLLEGSVAMVEPGLKARLESAFLTKYSALCKISGMILIFVSQFRTKIAFTGAGTTEGAGGGYAVKHYMDIRMCMKQKKKMEKTIQTGGGKQSVPYGSINEVWTTKCRLAPPYIPLSLSIVFGKGISNLAAYRDLLERHGRIQGSRGFFTILLGPDKKKEVKARGEHNLTQKIMENIDEVLEFAKSVGGIKLIEGDAVEGGEDE